MNLMQQGISITRGSTRHLNSSTDFFGTEVNLAGYEGVVFVALCAGINTTTAPTKLYAYESTSAGGTYSALAGFCTVDESSNKLLILDINKPLQQYMKPRIDRNSTKNNIDAVLTIRYGGHKLGISYPSTESTVADTTCLVSPTS